MNRNPIGSGAVAILLALLVAAWAVPAGAEDEDEGPLSAAELGQALAKAKVRMGDAAKTAEARVKGTAFAAEVEVNAETGKVMDVEEEGHDDDGDDDDDDGGDD